MKSSISNIISFIIMSIFSVVIIFLSFEYSMNRTVLLRKLEKMNYYEKIYNIIEKKIDDFVVNEEVLKLYSNYITKDLVKKDIISLVDSIYYKKLDVDRYDDFLDIIKKYSSDEKISKIYATKINDIYMSNLFPKAEFKLIHKAYFDLNKSLFIGICIMSIGLILSISLYFINKNLNYFKSIILGIFVMCLMPFVIVTILFSNLIYTNELFTDVILYPFYKASMILLIVDLLIVFPIGMSLIRKYCRK